jgi:uncharacterized protein YcbK (DUF882 family)
MKHFTIEELTRSATARRKGIPNLPNGEEKENLTALVDNVLDPLRELWGAPIIVTSGYRCPLLNKKVGGVATSYHMKGQAADIRAKNLRNGDLYALIKRMYMEGCFGLTECYIDERRGYIHIAFDAAENSVWPFFNN